MDKLLLQDAEPYASAHRRKRRWYQVMTCLAAAVVFCTTYALILPAITLEKQCEIPEHTHTEACYTSVQGDLICTQSTEPQHTHAEECYQETQALVCGMEESTGHTHGAECYDEAGNLICGQEESEGHVHGEGCYEVSRQLICGQTEEPAHQHTEACYSWNQVLTCGMEEHTHSEACTATEPEEPVFCGKEPHTHGESCRDEQGELTCTLEEHTHSLACYADPGADVETAEIWEQTFGDVTLTGDWRLDTLAIARSQLGYTESTRNYAVAEDGQTLMGYTRYGAWQGDPYGDWNALFAAFCLHYGGAENIPTDKDCGSWAAALADAFLPAQSHEAAPGELVFFDRDGDGTADWVAIVAEVTAGEEGAPSGITVIAGDADDAVQQRSYALEDPTILGYYGSLPEQAKAFTLTAQTESGITVTVTGDSAALPFPVSEITLTAAEVAEEQGQAIREQLPAEEGTEPEQRFLLDIALWHGEEEIEPVGPVTVTFSGLDTQGLYPKVYHIDTEAKEVTDMEAMKDDAGDITMSTEHFSLYAVQLLSTTDINGSQLGNIANGGTFRLTSGATWNDSITIANDTVLDLNGYGVYYQGTGNFLVVNSGAKLTIMDSQAPTETVTTGGDSLHGNTASLTFADNGNQPSMLTYYVTESSPSGTGTSETLKKYEVTPKGFIVGTATGTIVTVNSGGTFHLDGGLLTRKSSGDGHIISNNGTLNLTGGYVAGGNSSGWGGGVYSNGTVSMTGGVIAANSGNSGGGMFVDGGSFTMDGGIISGNKTHAYIGEAGNPNYALGGGIFAKNATVTINSGYITNNCENGACNQDSYGCHGGGGIATIGGNLTMAGGYVTGNRSTEAGGGMYVGHYNVAGTAFTMTGGTVASNCATDSEGGGIRISGGTNGTIEASGDKVYITNNCTNSDFDWGGGGIFVQRNGHLVITSSLITNNSAGGFGGGVGACPTGKTLIVNEDGAAIYGNEASGEHMSGGGNGKDYDTELASKSDAFKSSGYKDYFCVRDREGAGDYISLVTGLMAGGGAANWKGSCDEKPVTIGRTGYAAAKFLFGLTANPDSEAISSAQAAAHVLISGNSAYTHGGGIMTNGGLILGDPKGSVVTATPELDITGTKALVKDGVRQEGLKGFQFQFQLKGSTDTDVRTATADGATGEFTFQDIKFSQTGDYTYTLSEIKGDRADVTYDTKVHTIQVTIAENTISLLGVKFTSYYVSSVAVDGNVVGGSSGSGSEGDTQKGTFTVHFKKPDSWSDVYMYVYKNGQAVFEGWPGRQMNYDETEGYYVSSFEVNEKDTYNYVFNNGSGVQTNDITNISYAPGCEVWFDYEKEERNTANSSTGSTETGGVSRGANPDGSYTLVMEGDTFTNRMTTQVNLQIVKTDSVDDTKRLKDATFTLTKVGTENPEGPLTGTTDDNGIATFANIQRGATYYLRETRAPSGYMTAGPWILEVKESTATLYPATEGENGVLTQTSETGTQLENIGEDSIVFSAPISDQSWGYELPDTGGAGTTSYTAGGLALIFGAATLMYVHCKRRKEDEASS